jgi:hydroxymethylbilane synthase
MASTLRRSISVKIVIGTRSSKLALWQAEFVKSALQRSVPGLEVVLNKIKTTGDKILDVPLAKVGGKGLFVKEIEEALLRGEADIAVHSMKDVPSEFPEGLHLPVICEREDPRDALISGLKLALPEEEKHAGSSIYRLPKCARIGTSSLRRSCQLLALRQDLQIGQLRGNLETRLRKLDEGLFDAIILASAGVKRLGLKDRISELLPYEISLPAVGQGAVGIECRAADTAVNELIAPLNHPETFICVSAERAFLKRLEGGCQVPIAAHARLTGREGGIHGFDGKILLDGLVGSVSGDRIIRGRTEGTPSESEDMGVRLAEDLLARGAREILEEVYAACEPPLDGEISS